MKLYTVEVCIDDRKFTRVEASDSAYDLKMRYLDLYPKAYVRIKSNSKGKIYLLLGLVILIVLLLVGSLIVF